MNGKAAAAIAVIAIAAIGIGAGFMLMGSGPEDDSLSVVYDGNGGECEIRDDGKYRPGDTADVRFSPTPTKPGYIFMGWSTDKAGNQPELSENLGKEKVTFRDGDIRLYAMYRVDESRIDVGTFMKLDAKVSVAEAPSISCIGYMKVGVISKSNGFDTIKSEVKVDLLDGTTRIDTINQEKMTAIEPDMGVDGDLLEYRYGTYLYNGKAVPVIITKESLYEEPGVSITSYTGLNEPILYCMVMDYGESSGHTPMELSFELSEYEMKYTEPENEGKYHVFYDGNGGLCDAGDGESYNDGDEVFLRFGQIAFKDGYRFCGWSTDKDSTYPEYDNTRGSYSMTMGSEDVTLYAVYSKYLAASGVGSYFDYTVVDEYEIDHTYRYSAEVRATIIKNDGINQVYDIKGTATITDSSGTHTETVDRTFDTAYDYWGYNGGEIEFVDAYFEETTWNGQKIPGNWNEYEGTEYFEDIVDIYGYYDDVLYRSIYTCEYDDGDTNTVVTELTDFKLV